MDPKLPIRATTQEQIPIEDIQEDKDIFTYFKILPAKFWNPQNLHSN